MCECVKVGKYRREATMRVMLRSASMSMLRTSRSLTVVPRPECYRGGCCVLVVGKWIQTWEH